MLTPYNLENEGKTAASREYSAETMAALKSKELFARMRLRARVNNLIALFVPGRGLEDIKEIERCRSIASQYYGGLRRVALRSIVGSENKSHDFDRSFNPRHDYQEQRWLRVAQAYTADRLPPVSLVEIDGRYFVRDGHHRVSVARAMGAVEIDAEVVVWVPAARHELEKGFCLAAA